MKDNLKMEHKAERERQLQLMKERLAKRRLDQIEQFDAKNDLILAGYNIEPSNKASFQNAAIRYHVAIQWLGHQPIRERAFEN